MNQTTCRFHGSVVGAQGQRFATSTAATAITFSAVIQEQRGRRRSAKCNAFHGQAMKAGVHNRFSMVSRLILIWLVLLVDVSLAPAAPPTRSAPRMLLELDIARHGDTIIVPVQIGGQSRRFAIDTGSLGCVFDSGLRPFLGELQERTVMETAAGRIPAAIYAHGPNMAFIGEIDVSPQLGVCCADLHAESHGVGQLDGWLGADSLYNKVLTIDFDAGKLRFLDRAFGNLGVPLPLTWDVDDNGRRDGPFVDVRIPNIGPTKFLVDTGGCELGAGTLGKSLFDRLVADGVLRISGSSSAAVPGVRQTTRSARGRVSWIAVGPYFHNDMILCENGDLSVSTLGLGYLSRYVVTFDFQNDVMYLREGNEFSRAEQNNTSGLWFALRNGKIVVTKVFTKSPGDLAGIKQGDEVRSIDGVNTSATTVFECCRLVSRGRDVKLVVENQGERREVILRMISRPDSGARRNRGAMGDCR